MQIKVYSVIECTLKIYDINKFLVFEYRNKSLLHYRKCIKIYDISKLFLVTSCFSLWEFMYHWFIYVLAKKAFRLCALLIVRWGDQVDYATGHHHIIGVHATEKLLCLIVATVFEWTHYAIQFVACCTYVQLNRWCCKTRGTVIIVCKLYDTWHACLLRRSGSGPTSAGLKFLVDRNSWNVNEKTQNCEADTEEASWLLTLFLHSLGFYFSSVIMNQISSAKFCIFKCMATW